MQMAAGGNCGAKPRVARDVEPFFADDGQAFRRAIIDAIRRLPDREQYVMSMFYEHDMELRDIGAVLGVSESRACQLKARALARLRAVVVGF